MLGKPTTGSNYSLPWKTLSSLERCENVLAGSNEERDSFRVSIGFADRPRGE
jgi:hypothetical protein